MLGRHGRSLAHSIFEAPVRLLIRCHVNANQVTVVGTTLTIIAAVSLLAPGHLIIGPAVLGVILFADSLDGMVARLTGTSSPFGAFLDSTLDRLGDGAVFGSLTFYAATALPAGPIRLLAVISGICAIIGAGAVPYARARGESVGVVAGVGIAERTDRLVIALVAAFITGVSGWSSVLAIGLAIVALASLITVIQRIMYVARHLEELA